MSNKEMKKFKKQQNTSNVLHITFNEFKQRYGRLLPASYLKMMKEGLEITKEMIVPDPTGTKMIVIKGALAEVA